MRKNSFHFIILLTAITVSITAKAQEPKTQPRWSFDFFDGSAIPVGQFANTGKQNPLSGHVHTGNILEYSATYHLSRHWGIALLGGSQRHNSDLDETILPFTGPADPNAQWLAQFAPQHWKMTRLLAGGVYTLPLNRKQNLAVLARVLAGIQQTKTSEYGYLFNIPSGAITTSDFPGRTLPWALSYQADAGFQWRVYRWLALLVYGGYNGSRPSYTQHFPDDGILINGIAIPNANGAIIKFHYPTGSVLLRGGVELSL